MRARKAVSTRNGRPAHAHCEWLNDRHVGYCREPGRVVLRHPRGDLGILFVCTAHAIDALGDGKPLPIGGGPVGVAW
jgi:hypothetical protein